ncbi:hypothetical protein [Novipirellula maiorica]|uniref:hypothetical protein n=1 Tax=Novipirellula maiorica TaxID=1265734 RepID=UPI0005924DEB|nr:hypothetical protein [Rhodopirellula maiorica]
MTNSQRLETVRSRLCQWINDQCTDAVQEHGPVKVLSESLLIRDGFFCGRCFRTEAYRAVWFIEEDELKIYSNSGSLECVFTGHEIDQVEEVPSANESIIRMPERVTETDTPVRRAA